MRTNKRATEAMSLISKVANKHNIDPKLLNDVVGAYYDELNNKMASLSYSSIRLTGFGRLMLSRKKLEQVIQKTEKFLELPYSEDRHYLRQRKYLNETRLVILKKGLNKLIEKNEQARENYIKRLEISKANSRRD